MNPQKKVIQGSIVIGEHDSIRYKVTYFKMLKNKRVLVAVCSSSAAMVFLFFYDSILSNHLKSMGINEDYYGKQILTNN